MIDEGHYQRPARRMKRMIVVLGVAGSIASLILLGPRGGLGFLIGATVSLLSFLRYQRMVETFGAAPVARRRAGRFALQFAALAAAGYVIVKYLEVNRMALAIGLLVAGVAVTIEILYEMIYGI